MTGRGLQTWVCGLFLLQVLSETRTSPTAIARREWFRDNPCTARSCRASTQPPPNQIKRNGEKGEAADREPPTPGRQNIGADEGQLGKRQ